MRRLESYPYFKPGADVVESLNRLTAMLRQRDQDNEYRQRKVTDVAAATYEVEGTDEILLVSHTATAAVTVNLPTPALFQGRDLIVYDQGNNAGTNNITLSYSAATIATVSTNQGSVTVTATGAEWFISASS